MIIHVYRVVEEWVIEQGDAEVSLSDAIELVRREEKPGRPPNCTFLAVIPDGQ